jgi:hypothetical protein
LQSVNLKSLASEGKFHYINAISNPYSWTEDVFSESSNPAVAALQSIANAAPFRLDISIPEPLKKLYDMISRQISNAEAKGDAICVVIDCLNYLFDSLPSNQVLDFIQAVKSRVEGSTTQSTAVALVHSDSIEANDLRSLLHFSDLSVIVAGFKSGTFKDIDGQVQLIMRHPAAPPATSVLANSKERNPSFVFKVTDNTIKLDLVRKET